MIGLVLLAVFAAGFEIYTDKNSYAHAYLWGDCARDPALKACHPALRHGGFGGGARLP